MKNIAVVDGNDIYRKGLITYLHNYNDLKVVIDAVNVKQLIATLKNQKVDIALLDIETDDIGTIEYLTMHFPEIKILVLTSNTDEFTHNTLIEKGVNGFLFKDQGIETVIDSIYLLSKYKYYFENLNLKKVIAAKAQKKAGLASNVKFSDRELSIIELICQQYTNKEISSKLYISSRTVDNYKDKMIQKTNSKNTVGLVMYAFRNNIIT